MAARTASGLAAGSRSTILALTLASIAGHMPSRAESQSGRAIGWALGAQGGGAVALRTVSACSCREPKKARQEGSTELWSAAHLA